MTEPRLIADLVVGSGAQPAGAAAMTEPRDKTDLDGVGKVVRDWITAVIGPP